MVFEWVKFLPSSAKPIFMNFIIRLLITAAVAYGLSQVLSGVAINDFTTAIIFALVLGLLNLLVKPILVILTIPVTIITLGLFLLVINAIIILIADSLMDGIVVNGFWWALVFSVILSVLSSALTTLVGKNE